MPWRDWQFWLVSLAAGVGLWYVLRSLLPERMHFWRRGPRGKATSLTVGGKAPPARKKGCH